MAKAKKILDERKKVEDLLNQAFLSEHPPLKSPTEDDFGVFNPKTTKIFWCGCVVNQGLFGDPFHLETAEYNGDTITELHICRKRGKFKKIELHEEL